MSALDNFDVFELVIQTKYNIAMYTIHIRITYNIWQNSLAVLSETLTAVFYVYLIFSQYLNPKICLT